MLFYDLLYNARIYIVFRTMGDYIVILSAEDCIVILLQDIALWFLYVFDLLYLMFYFIHLI